jgi:hypothetical protein
MSITRDHGMVVFECDTEQCCETLETGRYDFADAVNELSEKGWKTCKVGDAWEHTCPDCA